MNDIPKAKDYPQALRDEPEAWDAFVRLASFSNSRDTQFVFAKALEWERTHPDSPTVKHIKHLESLLYG